MSIAGGGGGRGLSTLGVLGAVGVLSLAMMGCVAVPAPVEDGGGRVVRVEGAGLDREVAAGVVSAANRTRRQAGAGGLVVVEGMNAAAQAHAEHLRGRHELDHTSWIAGRKDPAARLDAEGVKWTRVGENLAQLSDRAGIPDATIQIWMNSPGHRHNLLDPQFNVTGVGVARDERGTYYIVQMYATQ